MLEMRQTAHAKPGRMDQAYRLRLDPITLESLKGIGEWFRSRNLNYSDSCLVRGAIRDLLVHLKESAPSDFGEITGRMEIASGVRGRRTR